MLDWSVSEIRAALERSGSLDNTLLVFTSDNGPWLGLPDRMLQDGIVRWDAGSHRSGVWIGCLSGSRCGCPYGETLRPPGLG